MSEKNKDRPRTCDKCGKTQSCTALEIKTHAAACDGKKSTSGIVIAQEHHDRTEDIIL